MADGSAHPEGYLGVSRSLSGRLWRERPADSETTRRHQLTHGLSEPLARALASRGVSAEQGGDFLNPTLKALFPDPSSFADMDRAAGLLVDALVARRKVAVFADYDVDGASSAAQLVRWFRAMGLEISIYVPDRILEGYGPSPAAFRRLKDEGADLVITVDCGAAAHDALAFAASIELPVVVVDHHLMRPGEIPAVAALVNPNRPDCRSGQGHLAAAGVVFVLLAALNREARRRGLFAAAAEPDIRAWLDLAAMGAIWLSVISSPPGEQGFAEGPHANELTRTRNAAPAHVLLDPDQKLARLYGAMVTPHIFIVDATGKLAYMGGADSIPSARAEDIPRATPYVRDALTALAAGQPITTPVTRPYGCVVKYRTQA